MVRIMYYFKHTGVCMCVWEEGLGGSCRRKAVMKQI